MKNLYESRLNFLGISLDLNLTLSYRININMIETYYCVMYKEMAIAATDKNCMTAVEILEEQEEGHYQMPKLAFVGSIHAISSILDRYCGFSRSLIEHGLELPKEWLIEDRDEKGEVQFDLPEQLPQAFVCNCDFATGRVIEKLEEKGLHVPEDVSVVGFDNYLYPGMADK